jgi:hypothetical protein
MVNDQTNAPVTVQAKRKRRTAAEIAAGGGSSKCVLRQRARYGEDIEFRVRRLINTYRSQDKAQGRGVCDLNLEEMLARVTNGICEATGVKLDLGPVGGGGMKKRRAFAFSFDRLHNDRPHTSDNIQVVCGIYNIMRSTYLEHEVEAFIEALRRPVQGENARLMARILAFPVPSSAVMAIPFPSPRNGRKHIPA